MLPRKKKKRNVEKVFPDFQLLCSGNENRKLLEKIINDRNMFLESTWLIVASQKI